jgi:hypothetical protein
VTTTYRGTFAGVAAQTTKVSVTMGREALGLAKAIAERTGMSVSSLVTAAVERGLPALIAELDRPRAADEWIAEMPSGTKPTPAEVEALVARVNRGHVPTDAEIQAALGRHKRSRRRRPSRKSQRR